MWEWACSGAEANESSADPAARTSPPAAAEQAPNDLGTSSPTSEAAATEPWAWTWTFTFCGETRTISTSAGTGTPLIWTWDWTWTWTCPNAATPEVQPRPEIGASPPLVTGSSGVDHSAGDAQPILQVAVEAPALTLPTVSFPTLPFAVEPGAAGEVMVLPIPTVDVEVEVAIPPAVLAVPTAPSLPSQATPFPAVDDAAAPTTTSPATQPPTHGTIARGARPAATARNSPAHPEPRAHHARPTKPTRAHGERSQRERQQLPLERRQPRQAFGSSSAGGVVPSALLIGFAALTGFIVLAAPGLGRRIRVARKLRPRSADRPPIDHPG